MFSEDINICIRWSVDYTNQSSPIINICIRWSVDYTNQSSPIINICIRWSVDYTNQSSPIIFLDQVCTLTNIHSKYSVIMVISDLSTYS